MAKNLRVKRSGVTLSYGLWRLGLSPKAIGLLYTIIGLGDIPEWEFSVNGLVKVFEASRTGRDSIQSGLKELEAARLLVRDRVRDASGRLLGASWVVSDQPMDEEEPVTGFPPQAEPQQYKDNRREEEEPPITPLATAAAGETVVKGRSSRIALQPSDLPETLAPVAERLCHWWSKAKAGARSADALKRLLTSLEKIRAEGGIEAVADQIEKAIAAKEERGKGWQSITYSNWVAYRPLRQAQQAQERALEAQPSHEQQEALRLAQSRPDLFQRAWFDDKGNAHVAFSARAHEAACAMKGGRYPTETITGTVETLRAEIHFLSEALFRVQGLDNSVCPF